MQDGCGLLTIEDQVAFYKAHGIATGLNFNYNNIEIFLIPAHDNCGNNFGTFDDFGVKNDQKVSNNMILMSKYKGKHGGKKGQKFGHG